MATRCECWHHRYGVVHVVKGCHEVFDHSQGTWDESLRKLDRDQIISIPSSVFADGMSAEELLKVWKEYPKNS